MADQQSVISCGCAGTDGILPLVEVTVTEEEIKLYSQGIAKRCTGIFAHLENSCGRQKHDIGHLLTCHRMVSAAASAAVVSAAAAVVSAALVSAAVVDDPPEPPQPASKDAAIAAAAITLTTFFIFFIVLFPPFLLLILFTKQYVCLVLCVN